MLQQTQVERVVPRYTAWLERWPTFRALATASPADVIREWRGLGYNRRALSLHRTAAAVLHEHGGQLPHDHAALLRLPGVGPYTAAALRSFAYEEPVAVADTNIARTIARAILGVESQRGTSPGAIAEAAAALLPTPGARDHNLALMDLGATVCAARAPRCGACPLSEICAWRAAGQPSGASASRPAPKFEHTARYARGRIVDALRAAPATTAELAAMLPRWHAARTADYLASLERDALVVRAAKDLWSLPVEAG
jgi:A/G-specific adenine glycosylase